jgi:hypothetical protein
MFTTLIERKYYGNEIKPVAEKAICARRKFYANMFKLITEECQKAKLITLEINEGKAIEILDSNPMDLAETLAKKLCSTFKFEFSIKSTTNSVIIYHKQFKLAEVFRAEAKLFGALSRSISRQSSSTSLPPLLEAIHVAKKVFNIEELEDWETHLKSLRSLVERVKQVLQVDVASTALEYSIFEETTVSPAPDDDTPGVATEDASPDVEAEVEGNQQDEDANDAIARAAIEADLYNGPTQASESNVTTSFLRDPPDAELSEFVAKHYSKYIKLPLGIERVGAYFAEQTIAKEKGILEAFLSNYYTVNVTYKKIKVPLPLDYYTQIYYLYVHKQSQTSLVAILFMNTKIELIPYITVEQREAEAAVCAWYLLVDIWKSILLVSTGHIPLEMFKEHIRRQYARLEEEVKSVRIDNHKQMAGTYFSANILGKLAALSTLGQKNNYYCYEIIDS